MKSNQPCDACKGRLSKPCQFCGWAAPEKKRRFFPPKEKKPQLTNAQIVARDGKREATMYRNKFSHISLKFGNCTTGLESLDKEVEQHRIFGKELYSLHNVEGKSLTSIADEFDLTVNQVKQILATTLFQINQEAADRPNPARPGPKKQTDEEIAEIRRVRDTPKPKKKPTFHNVRTIYDELAVPHEVGKPRLVETRNTEL